MTAKDKLILMDRARIDRSLRRIAYQIREQNREDKPVLLCGIDVRGYLVSQTLCELLKPLSESDVMLEQIFVKDDKQNPDDFPAAGAYVVVTDDVIFSGRTMFRALKLIDEHTDVSEIHTAVLIDRGHRKFPVMAEFCGMELHTKLNEHVTVNTSDGSLENVELKKSDSG